MRLLVNGEMRDLELEVPNVGAVLDALALPRARVAVELNHSLVRKSEHDATSVSEGDRLEVVTLVGGG